MDGCSAVITLSATTAALTLKLPEEAAIAERERIY